jgi:hypothetical protein
MLFRRLKRPKKPSTAATSEVNDRLMVTRTQPASLRCEEDISTASPSPPSFLSDDALQAFTESALLPQSEESALLPQPEESKLEISKPPAELKYALFSIE